METALMQVKGASAWASPATFSGKTAEESVYDF